MLSLPFHDLSILNTFHIIRPSLQSISSLTHRLLDRLFSPFSSPFSQQKQHKLFFDSNYAFWFTLLLTFNYYYYYFVWIFLLRTGFMDASLQCKPNNNRLFWLLLLLLFLFPDKSQLIIQKYNLLFWQIWHTCKWRNGSLWWKTLAV